MAGKSTAIDIGSHSIKALAVKVGKQGVQVTGFAAVPEDEGAGGLDGSIQTKGVICGLSGRDMNLRYSQVPPTPDWQLRNLMDLEIQDLSEQSGGALSADYNLLPISDPEAGVDTVLLALARDEALERLTSEVADGGGTVDGFTPNCVAIYNAYLKCGPVDEDSLVCLCNVGHQTIDVALVRGQDLLFARNLTGGGKVLDDAIAAAFNVSPRKAEVLKRDLLDLDPQSRGRFASSQAEKVTLAAGGASSAISAAIQSSLAFCKTQTKTPDLRLDKVLVSGGGARIRGVRGMLREALRCPVELFDPFDSCDLSVLPEGEAEQLQAMRYEAVVALGLAVARCDDTLYQIEILPAAVRRRKRFQERTVYNILAGALAVVLLVMFMNSRKAAVEGATTAAAGVRFSVGQISSVHRRAEALLEENLKQRAAVEFLTAKAVPLHGLLRVSRSVTEHLPPQLWLERIEVRGGSGSGRRDQTPEIVIRGKGKEINGVEVGRVLQEYVDKVRNDPRLTECGGVMTYSPSPGGASTIEFEFSVAFGAEREEGKG